VITIDQLTGWMRRFNDLVIKNQAELTELDSAIGDADHGINMARGMSAVINKLAGDHPVHVNELFKTVAMTLVTSVGGASGPLYGTFFLRFAGATGLTFDINWNALEAQGVSRSTKVRLRLENVTVAVALDELLRAGLQRDDLGAYDRLPDGRILIGTTKDDPRIEQKPVPEVVVRACAASSVDLMLHFWIREERYEDAMVWEYLEKAKKALDAAGIEIPFPHMQVMLENTPAVDKLAGRGNGAPGGT